MQFTLSLLAVNNSYRRGRIASSSQLNFVNNTPNFSPNTKPIHRTGYRRMYPFSDGHDSNVNPSSISHFIPANTRTLNNHELTYHPCSFENTGFFLSSLPHEMERPSIFAFNKTKVSSETSPRMASKATRCLIKKKLSKDLPRG